MATNSVDSAPRSGSSASHFMGRVRTLCSPSRTVMIARCGTRLAITICTSSVTGVALGLVAVYMAVGLRCT